MQDELYIAFESYLCNEMSEVDKIAFEKRLKEDAEFLVSFNLYKETSAFTAHKFSEETALFKNNLKSVSRDYFEEQKPKKSKLIQLRPILYAVAAVLVLFFGLQLFQSDPQFEDYNQFGNASITERGEVPIDNLKKAQDAFNAKKYKEAIPLFESVIKVYKTSEIDYLYAIALLQENRIPEAEAIFNSLKNNNISYKDNAIWCLALAKLKQKDHAACKALILQISEEGDYYEVSRKLLKEID
jgi:predicted Zn-dependent protease